ncbi:MAG: DUF5131 family protein [Nitrospiraceae bacterium]
MAENTDIEWCDATINLWWGCTKAQVGGRLDEACRHCYAEAGSKMRGHRVWGRNAERRFMKDPLGQLKKWNRWAAEGRCRECKGRGYLGGDKGNYCSKCGRSGRVPPYNIKVFAMSYGDLFEKHSDEAINARMTAIREEFFVLVPRLRNLTFLCLTKRPENVMWMVPNNGSFPPNVWIGTSVADQESLDKRWPDLAAIPARVRFVSAEPLLEGVDFSSALHDIEYGAPGGPVRQARKLEWLILGGESGPKARPSHPRWFEFAIEQCRKAGVPVFFKQWGEWAPWRPSDRRPVRPTDICMEPDGSRRRGCDALPSPDSAWLRRVGKKAAGATVLGREWQEFPR